MERMSGIPEMSIKDGKLSSSRMDAENESTLIEPNRKNQPKIPKKKISEKSSTKTSSLFKFWEQKTSLQINQKSPMNDPSHKSVQPTRMENVPSTFVVNQQRYK